MATHIVDNTNFYNVASPGTGAASGDTFFLTAANIDLVVNGLNNDGIAIETTQRHAGHNQRRKRGLHLPRG